MTYLDKHFLEKMKKWEEEKWKRMTDYERACSYLKAHAGYSETKERLMRFMKEANVKESEAMLKRLIREGKIKYNPRAELWAYTLKFIVAKEEE